MFRAMVFGVAVSMLLFILFGFVVSTFLNVNPTFMGSDTAGITGDTLMAVFNSTLLRVIPFMLAVLAIIGLTIFGIRGFGSLWGDYTYRKTWREHAIAAKQRATSAYIAWTTERTHEFLWLELESAIEQLPPRKQKAYGDTIVQLKNLLDESLRSFDAVASRDLSKRTISGAEYSSLTTTYQTINEKFDRLDTEVATIRRSLESDVRKLKPKSASLGLSSAKSSTRSGLSLSKE